MCGDHSISVLRFLTTSIGVPRKLKRVRPARAGKLERHARDWYSRFPCSRESGRLRSRNGGDLHTVGFERSPVHLRMARPRLMQGTVSPTSKSTVGGSSSMPDRLTSLVETRLMIE